MLRRRNDDSVHKTLVRFERRRQRTPAPPTRNDRKESDESSSGDLRGPVKGAAKGAENTAGAALPRPSPPPLSRVVAATTREPTPVVDDDGRVASILFEDLERTRTFKEVKAAYHVCASNGVIVIVGQPGDGSNVMVSDVVKSAGGRMVSIGESEVSPGRVAEACTNRKVFGSRRAMPALVMLDVNLSWGGTNTATKLAAAVVQMRNQGLRHLPILVTTSDFTLRSVDSKLRGEILVLYMPGGGVTERTLARIAENVFPKVPRSVVDRAISLGGNVMSFVQSMRGAVSMIDAGCAKKEEVLSAVSVMDEPALNFFSLTKRVLYARMRWDKVVPHDVLVSGVESDPDKAALMLAFNSLKAMDIAARRVTDIQRVLWAQSRLYDTFVVALNIETFYGGNTNAPNYVGVMAELVVRAWNGAMRDLGTANPTMPRGSVQYPQQEKESVRAAGLAHARAMRERYGKDPTLHSLAFEIERGGKKNKSAKNAAGAPKSMGRTYRKMK